MVKVLRKIISGEYVCRDRMGFYILDKDSIKESLYQDGELMVEDWNGTPVGHLFVDENNSIGFLPLY